MYVASDDTSPVILQYSLTTPFDISTATKIGSGTELEGHGGDFDKPHAIEFKPDGTIMYVTGRRNVDGDTVIQYSLTTPFDISTATKTSETV